MFQVYPWARFPLALEAELLMSWKESTCYKRIEYINIKILVILASHKFMRRYKLKTGDVVKWLEMDQEWFEILSKLLVNYM